MLKNSFYLLHYQWMVNKTIRK